MKLQKISDIENTIPFTEFDVLRKYRESFKRSELGRIRQQLPLKELADYISTKNRKKKQGRKSMFPAEGEVALMFLRAYTGLSDDALVEMLNGSIHMQMFCGVFIDPLHPLKDGKIISAIRNRLAKAMDIKEIQCILFKQWGGRLKNLDRCLTDATCYESHLRFPTDVKLLWESCEWLHTLMTKTYKKLKVRQPRNKSNDVAKARLAYAKKRKPKKSATRKLLRRLLKLLQKLQEQWNRLFSGFSQSIPLTAEQVKRLSAIQQVYSQQSDLFEKKEVKQRIVSIDRPYIRPIIRGKENKRVEFGAKVNNILIDGLSFIEHHSFEAFNEGVRLVESIKYQEELTGVKVKEVGADCIYANNVNRSYCTEHNIQTSFARKGSEAKGDETKTVRRILGNLRSTMLEGSFGNQKQHYGVSRIAARNQASETLQLFFAIHMSNAAILAGRDLAAEEREAEKQKKPNDVA